MIGKILGGALALGGSIFGGISASKAMKKAKGNVEAQRKANEDWYNRRYNESSTQRADVQRVLEKTLESIRERNRQAAGVQAVMGGTEESVAAAKAANNEALAEAASQIAVAGERRKDSIESTYRAKDDAYVDKLNEFEVGKAKAISNAVQGVASAAGDMMSAF